MDQAAFETMLRRDGYEMVARSMAPGAVSPEHAHAFDARVLVTAGTFTLTIGGARRTYDPGEWCDVPAGTRHAEECGPDGVSLIIGRRSAAA